MNTQINRKTKRIAFMGFRHGHIMGLYKLAAKADSLEIVATCEEDAQTRDQLSTEQLEISHTDYADMLDQAQPEIVAIGDYYGRRGSLMIEALRRGCHVISDKPICTDPAEWSQIRDLAADGNRCVGCQLDLRDSGKFLALRRLLQQERIIGDVHAIGFGGQHPLNYGTRPEWYFEPGKHGGTINDIAIHAIDLIPWVTGNRFTHIHAARNWNAGFAPAPHFRDAAQLMLSMDNGCGVLGDVSYLSPTQMGYSFPLYWRFTFWGRKGVIETDQATPGLTLYRDDRAEPELIPPDPEATGGYLQSFLREIDGATEGLSPSSADVLESSRVTLLTQQAADKGIAPDLGER